MAYITVQKDILTVNRLGLLHPAVRLEAQEIYDKVCLALNGRAICRVSHTLRTFYEQNQLFEQGRTKPGRIVTSAKGGQSYHNYGLALDIVLLKDTNGNGKFNEASWETDVDFDGDGIADWMEVVDIFRSYGWQWGLINSRGKRYDLPHFQKTFGYHHTELLKMYNNNHTDKNNYVLIETNKAN